MRKRTANPSTESRSRSAASATTSGCWMREGIAKLDGEVQVKGICTAASRVGGNPGFEAHIYLAIPIFLLHPSDCTTSL